MVVSDQGVCAGWEGGGVRERLQGELVQQLYVGLYKLNNTVPGEKLTIHVVFVPMNNTNLHTWLQEAMVSEPGGTDHSLQHCM